MFSASDVQKLRESTGAPVMDCKKALQDAGGDFDKAKELIQKRGLVKAESKASRALGAGHIESYIHNNRVGVMLQIYAETDFVTRSEPFRELAHELAMQIASMNPQTIEDLLSQPYIKDANLTVDELIKGVISKTGENIKLEKFIRYEI